MTIEKILSIDIGGTNIKAAVLSKEGKLLTKYKKLPTPNPATPKAVLDAIKELVKDLTFDHISSGFPGSIKNGIVQTAPNLGTDYWKGTDWPKVLQDTFKKPARAINDADMLGLGVVKGEGFEMVVTLGTGFGSAIYYNGHLLPHLELAHHPLKNGKDYDQLIGEKAFKRKGKKKWNKDIRNILNILKVVFDYDTLYVGGGNAKKIDFELDSNIKLVTNLEGIDGGAKLWTQDV